jgi:hypothetical protein
VSLPDGPTLCVSYLLHGGVPVALTRQSRRFSGHVELIANWKVAERC